MPYIKQAARDWIDLQIPPGLSFDGPGELNYAFTGILKEYLGLDPHYAKFNEVIGVLECCKLEIYRRMVAPYEDLKIQENGDV